MEAGHHVLPYGILFETGTFESGSVRKIMN